MRTLFLVAPLLAAAPAFAAPRPYVEVGLGVADARANDIDQTIDYSVTQVPASPVAPAASDAFVDDVFGTRSKVGAEGSVAAGVDFGWLRLEGELAHRFVRTSRIAADDGSADFLAQLNGALNRPSVAPDPDAPGLAPVTLADFQRGGRISSTAAMFNTIFDVKVAKRLTLFAGAGIGRNQVRGFGDKDSARAWQYSLGLRMPVGDRFEVGLKHVYFDSGMIKLVEAPRAFAGNPDAVAVGAASVVRTTNAAVSQDLEGNWRTRSVQLTLGYRF